MSRDWTPVEHYLVVQRNFKNGGLSIFDSMRSTVVSYNGKTWPRYSEEEMNAREQFPVLGKLLGPFMELYERLSKINGGVDLLHAKDAEVAQFIASNFKSSHEPLAVKWFMGELDEHFHYSDKNNRAFVEGVVTEAKELSGEQKRLYEEYKQEWYSAHGITPDMIAALHAEYEDDCANRRYTGSFEQYELDWGYNGGEVYACFEEFLDNEYQEMKQNAVDSVLAIAEARSAETVTSKQDAPGKDGYILQ